MESSVQVPEGRLRLLPFTQRVVTMQTAEELRESRHRHYLRQREKVLEAYRERIKDPGMLEIIRIRNKIAHLRQRAPSVELEERVRVLESKLTETAKKHGIKLTIRPKREWTSSAFCEKHQQPRVGGRCCECSREWKTAHVDMVDPRKAKLRELLRKRKQLRKNGAPPEEIVDVIEQTFLERDALGQSNGASESVIARTVNSLRSSIAFLDGERSIPARLARRAALQRELDAAVAKCGAKHCATRVETD